MYARYVKTVLYSKIIFGSDRNLGNKHTVTATIGPRCGRGREEREDTHRRVPTDPVTMASAAAAIQTIPGPTRKALPTTTMALETPTMATAPAPANTAPTAVCSAESSSETDEEELDESVPTTAMTPAGCHTFFI